MECPPLSQAPFQERTLATDIQSESRANARGRLGALSLLLALTLLPACTAAHAQQQLQILPHHLRPAVSTGQAPLLGSLPPEQDMHVSMILPLRNEPALTSLLLRLYDPTSPDYHRFLTVEQFTEQFGPTPQDYAAVVAYAKSHGLTVAETPANRLIVPVNGSVAQINKAFSVTMQVYRHPTENRTFYSPDREPALNLAVPLKHISGLTNFSLPHPAVATALPTEAIANVLGSGPGSAYLGSDMRNAYYGGSTLTGNGQAVGILEFGGYDLSDINLTFSSAGQSYTVPINNVLFDGASAASTGDDAEQVLDIVQAIGMAPGLSQVRVYIGPANGAVDDAHILNSMASENIAKQLSCSWSWDPDDPGVDDVFFKEFAAQGQSFFAASGDDGAFDYAVSPYFYPAEDAYVTAVGATHLTTSNGAWAAESAWNSSGRGTGGGISPDGIPIPGWQSGFPNASNAGSTTLRNVPDVAMEGDFDNYNCAGGSCNGATAGTSFAAPRWAGFMALVNQQAVNNGTAPAGGVGFINPLLYAVAAGSSYNSDFHDPATGNNDTAAQPVWFNAVPGYDLATGVGSPNGQNLINALVGPQVPGFWLQSSSSTVTLNQGSSGSASVTVTSGGGFNGSVTFAVTSGLPTGVTASFSPNPTTGSTVLTLTATSSAPLNTATVTVTGTSGTLTATTNLSVTVQPASLTVAVAPTMLTINQGGSGTTTVTVSTPTHSSVSLAASGLPSGVTASFSPKFTTSTSNLTFTASSTASLGPYTVTITGTSGGNVATTTFTVAVHVTPTVSVKPSSSSITTTQSLPVTVGVATSSGKPTATGYVTLSSGGYTSNAATLASGSATITIPANSLATGSDILSATYTPDATSSVLYNSASGSGTVTVTAGSTPAATASITISGTANPGDSSAITVAFNGFTETVRYDKSSNASSIASALAAMFSRDDLKSGLCAAATANVISFKLKQGAFTSVSITGSNVSFQLAPAGFP